MSRNKKEGVPIRPPIKTLWIGDHQIEEFFVPYKGRMEEQMEGEIEFISNPQEVLGILEEKAENGSLPDILVIKSYMSGTNELELIKVVKSHQDSRVNSLPICVLAGYLEESEKAQLEELGIKIFNLALIKENLHQIRWAWEESQEKEPNPQLLKIIWVDDNRSVIGFVRRVLKEKFGWEVESLESAKEALEVLEKRAEEDNLPDIIISDFSIPPGMSGLKFAQAIRGHQDERINSLPFCLASGYRFTKQELKTFEELNVFILDKNTALTEPQKIRQILEESKRRA